VVLWLEELRRFFVEKLLFATNQKAMLSDAMADSATRVKQLEDASPLGRSSEYSGDKKFSRREPKAISPSSVSQGKTQVPDSSRFRHSRPQLSYSTDGEGDCQLSTYS